jgi:hypothetical protein
MRPLLGLLCALAVTFAAIGAARADVVRLKNGRILEGRIVRRTPKELHVQLATGDGIMIVPLTTVAVIESRSCASEELALRAAQVDPTDPVAVTELAAWASSHGLGEEAQDLNALAFGVRLEQRVAAARAARCARDFAATYLWARDLGASDDVLAWLVAQAQGICADDPEVQDAADRLAKDRAALAQRAAREDELRRRPHYLDPGKPHPLFTGTVAIAADAPAPDPGARGRALMIRLSGGRTHEAAHRAPRAQTTPVSTTSRPELEPQELPMPADHDLR